MSAAKLTTEELKAELWYRGKQELGILSPAQKRIQLAYDSKADPSFVVECSRQLGKTYWACFLADKVARANPNCQIRLATAFEVDIPSIIVPNYKNVLSSCPEPLHPKYSRGRYTYPNGAQVLFVGLDKNPNKLRGNRILLIIIEEAGFVDSEKLQYVLDSVIAGAQLRESKARTVLISTPPEEGQDHYFCTVADQCELAGSYIKITIDESGLPPEAIEAFVKKLGGRHTVAFRREGLCERILDKTRALCEEWDDRFVQEIEQDEYFTYYHKLTGQDLGRVDHTALLYGYYDFKRAALVITHESTMDGPAWTTETLKAEILNQEKEAFGEHKPFRRISDNNNPHLLMDLGSIHNIHFMAVTKDSSLEQMVNRVREWVKAGRVLVHPRCKMMVGCLKYGVWDKNRKEFAKSKVYGHYDHFAALMYTLIHTPAASNPIPADHGFLNHQAWLGNIKDKLPSKNAETFKKLYGPKAPSTTSKGMRTRHGR